MNSLVTSSNAASTAGTSTSTRKSFLQGARFSTVTFTINPFDAKAPRPSSYAGLASAERECESVGFESAGVKPAVGSVRSRGAVRRRCKPQNVTFLSRAARSFLYVSFCALLWLKSLVTSRGYKLVQLANGARGVHSLAYGETMHPVIGPAAEAVGLYVKQLRLVQRIRKHAGEFVIWDVGLGA